MILQKELKLLRKSAEACGERWSLEPTTALDETPTRARAQASAPLGGPAPQCAPGRKAKLSAGKPLAQTVRWTCNEKTRFKRQIQTQSSH